MTEKRDKLGRLIPQFDRSESGKRAAQTIKEKYGDDHFSKIRSKGGKMSTRGNFGKMKDDGREEELKKLASQGGKQANVVKNRKRVYQGETDDQEDQTAKELW